jgi:type-F conjugative transfer system pilin assembly protein TrbC
MNTIKPMKPILAFALKFTLLTSTTVILWAGSAGSAISQTTSVMPSPEVLKPHYERAQERSRDVINTLKPEAGVSLDWGKINQTASTAQQLNDHAQKIDEALIEANERMKGYSFPNPENIRINQRPYLDMLNQGIKGQDNLQPIDPAQIAAQFAGTEINEPHQLLIFVSLSMPMVSLEALARDAKTIGATLVFRGLRHSLGEQNNLKKAGKPSPWIDMAKVLEPLIKTGARVQIDPTVFSRFNVTSVPTVVLLDKKTSDDSCSANCTNNHLSQTGEQKLIDILDDLSNRPETALNKELNQELRQKAALWAQQLKERSQ